MIVLKNVNKIYGHNEKVALFNVNLAFDNNGLVFIIGKSGSGKTTLLNILGLLDKKTSGDIIIDGINTNRLSRYELNNIRSNYFNYIFQKSNLLEDLNVLDNINLPSIIGDTTNDYFSLNNFGLAGYENKYPNELSGGENQRVAIIRGIKNPKKVVLCDEPTANLDGENESEVLLLLKELSKKSLVIVITHNLDLVKKYADRVIEISDGVIINDTNSKNQDFHDKEVKINNSHSKRMPIIYALELAFSTIRFRVFKTIMTSLILLVTTTILATLISILSYNPVNVLKMEMDNYYYSPTKTINSYDQYADVISDTINNSEYLESQLESTFDVSSLGYYIDNIMDQRILFIENTEASINQLIMSKTFYTKQFNEEKFQIGKKFYINDVKFDIVGITDKPYSYTAKESLNSLKVQSIPIRGGLFKTKSITSLEQYLNTTVYYLNAANYEETKDIQLADDEMLLSIGLSKYVNQEERQYFRDLSKIKSEELSSNYIDLSNIFPNGVTVKKFVSNGGGGYYAFVNSNVYNEILEMYHPFDGFVILDNADPTIIADFYIRNNYKFNDVRLDSIVDFHSTIENELYYPLISLIAIFSILDLFVCLIWCANVFSLKKSEIGILKTQGLNNISSTIPCFITSIVPIVISSVLCIITTLITIQQLNQIFYNLNPIYNYDVLCFDFHSILTILIYFITFILISWAHLQIKLSRNSIMQLFKIRD